MTASPAPLAGIRVLDLGQVYNGPYCALLLAYHGADVIKIEPPHGDVLRMFSRAAGGASYPFLMLNTSKRGVRLNLKDPRGRDLFLRLVETADVVVENFAAGVMERLGLGFDAIQQRNPRIILASGSGFGSTGPYVGYPAMDFTMQALVGAMSVTGFPDAPPVKCGPTFIDMLGGTHLLAGVLLALRTRDATGRGTRVEVAMFDAAVAAMLSYLAPYYELGAEITRSGNRHVVRGATPYNVYRCTDGDVAILCLSDKHWRDLCGLMGRTDLAAEARWQDAGGRADDADAIDALVEAWTSVRPRDQVAHAVAGAGIPCAPVRHVAEVATDRHLFERGALRELTHPDRGPVKVLGNPIHVDGEPQPELAPAPALGADTEAVLQELLGINADEVTRLREAGVV